MTFKIEECKRGNWQVKEKIVLDIGTFYLLEERDEKQLLDKVWRIMCEMQESYDKGDFEYPFHK